MTGELKPTGLMYGQRIVLEQAVTVVAVHCRAGFLVVRGEDGRTRKVPIEGTTIRAPRGDAG